MRKPGILAAWVGLTACVSKTNVVPNDGPADAPPQGRYAFTANLPDQQLRGTLQLSGNRILLEPAAALAGKWKAPTR